jgi:hypothetical protein
MAVWTTARSVQHAHYDFARILSLRWKISDYIYEHT